MKIFWAFMKATIGSNVTYRGAIVVWMLISLIRTGIALLMWLASSNPMISGNFSTSPSVSTPAPAVKKN